MFTIGSFQTSHKIRTYTPTVSNTTGVDASTPGTVNFIKIGDYIHLWGSIDLDLTANSAFNLDISLPVSVTSNFTNATDAWGILYFAGNLPAASAGIIANTATDKLQIVGRGSSNSNLTYYFTAGYKIQ